MFVLGVVILSLLSFVQNEYHNRQVAALPAMYPLGKRLKENALTTINKLAAETSHCRTDSSVCNEISERTKHILNNLIAHPDLCNIDGQCINGELFRTRGHYCISCLTILNFDDIEKPYMVADMLSKLIDFNSQFESNTNADVLKMIHKLEHTNHNVCNVMKLCTEQIVNTIKYISDITPNAYQNHIKNNLKNIICHKNPGCLNTSTRDSLSTVKNSEINETYTKRIHPVPNITASDDTKQPPNVNIECNRRREQERRHNAITERSRREQERRHNAIIEQVRRRNAQIQREYEEARRRHYAEYEKARIRNYPTRNYGRSGRNEGPTRENGKQSGVHHLVDGIISGENPNIHINKG